MKIAIHHRSGSFSEGWITYCEEKGIPYKIVNAFDSDIISQIKDCSVFMWHHHHGKFKDVIAAKRILFALEHAGIKVFPNFKTGWHFDDKVAQKYLLEAIAAPLVPSYVFYDKKEAIEWANKTNYPKIFKLKGGAGAANVKLVRTRKDAIRLINKAFGKGFKQFDGIRTLKERLRNFKEGRGDFIGLLKGLALLFFTTDFSKKQPPERGYIYFQDFIENDGFDIRVLVINNRAIAFKRLVRKNDFRASGSGNIVFEYEKIDKEFVRLAFDIAKKLNSESLAMDFVKSRSGEISVIEISYGFTVKGFDEAFAGYWDSSLNWNNERFYPVDWILTRILTYKNEG